MTGRVMLFVVLCGAVSQAQSRYPLSLDQPSSALVSVHNLGVPRSATKRVEKANRLIVAKNPDKAVELLQKAIALDANYSDAYNSLGVAYYQLSQPSQAEEAFQKAISVDNRFAQAYVNLGYLKVVKEKDFVSAESILSEAAALQPPSFATLNLLAYSQLQNQHFAQALETCHQGHNAQLDQHNVLHLIAARVYQIEHRPAEARAEMKLYLSEISVAPPRAAGKFQTPGNMAAPSLGQPVVNTLGTQTFMARRPPLAR